MLTPLVLCALVSGILGQSGEGVGFAEPSPPTFALELRLGPFRPHVDKAFPAGQGPYAQLFGKKRMLLGELEVDWQFFHGFGSLGLGLAGGYAEAYGKALVPEGEAWVDSGQTTSLKIIPLKLLLIWRMDIFANHFEIPFVPYGKLGLMTHRWWTAKGGKTSEVGGQKGSGWRSGWLGVVGLSVQLDAFDRQLAKDIDTGIGIKHSYLFAEYAFEQVQSFGKPGINLSAGHWMFGLAFEF